MWRNHLDLTAKQRLQSTRGFTLTEALIAVALLGMVASIVGTRVAPLVSRTGASQAASLVALDLEKAVTIAARQRKPVRVSCDCSNNAYLVTDRASGNILLRRALSGNASYGVTGMEFSVASIDIFPSGLTSGALTITLRAGTVSRLVTMSSGAFVQVVR